MFYSRSSVIPGFVVKSVIHFEYIWIEVVLFFHMNISLFIIHFISFNLIQEDSVFAKKSLLCVCACLFGTLSSSTHHFCVGLLVYSILIMEKVLYNFVLSVKQKKRDLLNCGHMGKRIKEIQRSSSMSLEFWSEIKVQIEGQDVVLPTLDPSLSGLQSCPVGGLTSC